MASLLWKQSGGTVFQPSLAAVPHRSRAQGRPGEGGLPSGLPQGEGRGKARSFSPCGLGRALLQPQPHHLGRGTCTGFEVVLCLGPAHQPWGPRHLRIDLFLFAHPFAQLCAAAAPTLTHSEQPAPLQTKETCFQVKKANRKSPLAQGHFHWGLFDASPTQCSVRLPFCHTWVYC